MENERNTDKLAGYIIKLGGLAAIVALCWYFKNVLIYVIVAFVVSMIGRPLMQLMRKVKVKGKSAPDWLLALLTLLVVIALMALVESHRQAERVDCQCVSQRGQGLRHRGPRHQPSGGIARFQQGERPCRVVGLDGVEPRHRCIFRVVHLVLFPQGGGLV